MLRVGAVLSAPILDPLNPRVKLLTEGTMITHTFIELLAVRRVDSVILAQRDIAILSAFSPQGRRTKVPPAPAYVQSHQANDWTRAIDARINDGQSMELPISTTPMSDQIKAPADRGYADGLTTQWAYEANTRIDIVSEFFADTGNDASSDVEPLREICGELLDRMTEDLDAMTCLASAPYDSDYPTRHGIHIATIAMAIGIQMGLGRDVLVELGIGCLVHDIGMQAVGLNMFDTDKPLSPEQLKRLADHPVKAIEIAGGYGDGISDLASFVIYQIHERGDGSGYPRGYTSEAIHPLAKIAAVADVFVGMLTNRKHRLAIQGYYSIVNLLEDMKKLKFDAKVVRALLQAVSLYPLGSLVTLSNDRIGRVIRSGGADFAKPTIEMWRKDRPNDKPAVVNLKHDVKIKITGTRAA